MAILAAMVKRAINVPVAVDPSSCANLEKVGARPKKQLDRTTKLIPVTDD